MRDYLNEALHNLSPGADRSIDAQGAIIFYAGTRPTDAAIQAEIARLQSPENIAYENWQAEIATTDGDIPRWLEDHIEHDHGGITSAAHLQGKYDTKKAVRGRRPDPAA